MMKDLSTSSMPPASLEYQYYTDNPLNILPIFPVTDGEIDFDTIDCDVVGQQVNLVDDDEVPDVSVLEIIGAQSSVNFFGMSNGISSLSQLAIHFKNTNRYFTLMLALVDSNNMLRNIEISNKRSTIYIDNNDCRIPMEIKVGWQYINLDMNSICHHAFGTTFRNCKELQIHGSCRVSKIYLQDKEYADAQLPVWLRVGVKDDRGL